MDEPQSMLMWLWPVAPILLLAAVGGFQFLLRRRTRTKRKGRRLRDIAHERAWKLLHGRKTNKMITYLDKDEAEI